MKAMPDNFKNGGAPDRSRVSMDDHVRFIDIGHMGQSERQKYRDGDEEDRTSKRDSLTSPPAPSERSHRSLARRLMRGRTRL